MRRLLQGYLTIAAVLIMLANLVLVVIYSRQFHAASSSDCLVGSCGNGSVVADFVLTNTIVIGLLLVGLFIIAHLFRSRSRY